MLRGTEAWRGCHVLRGTETRGGACRTAQSRGHSQHKLRGRRQPWSVWESDRPGGESRLLALVPGRPRASCPPLWNKMFTPVSASICGVWAVSQPVPCGGRSGEQGWGASLFLVLRERDFWAAQSLAQRCGSPDRALLTVSPLCFEYVLLHPWRPPAPPAPPGHVPWLSPARLLPRPCSASRQACSCRGAFACCPLCLRCTALTGCGAPALTPRRSLLRCLLLRDL